MTGIDMFTVMEKIMLKKLLDIIGLIVMGTIFACMFVYGWSI